MILSYSRTRSWLLAVAATVAFAAAQLPAAEGRPQTGAETRQSLPGRACLARGLVTSTGTPLPGAVVTVRAGETTVAVSSTDLDGTFAVALAAGSYTLHVELMGFASADLPIAMSEPSCQLETAVSLALASRVPGAALAPAPPASVTAVVAGGRGGRGAGGRFGGAPRFQALTVRASEDAPADGPASISAAVVASGDDPAARLLPPGFSLDTSLESIAVSGSMVTLDRAGMNERGAALERGEFDLSGGQVPGQTSGSPAGDVPAGGGRGGGGPGGRGGFAGAIAGRGIAGGSRLQVTGTYGLGGSGFDAAPYALRGEAPQSRDYLQQSMSTTIGGPLRIPGVYNGTGRTTFNASYTAGRNGDLFDQYATVPSDAFRQGDFSASSSAIVDPITGAPFPGNEIPLARIDPAALALLSYIPAPTLSGDTQNFRYTATSHSTTDAISLRITHSLTQPIANGGRGGRGGFGGGAVGGRGGPASAGQGRGGAVRPALNVTMNAAVNYRRNEGDRLNVFPSLAGHTRGSTLSIPVTINMRAGRSMHAFSLSLTRTASTTLGNFAFSRDVAGLAGIEGVATDPFDWGLPNVSFGSLTSVRDVAPSQRTDRSFQAGYAWTRPIGTHTLRAGGTYQQQQNSSRSDTNARGAYTFTGLYSSGGGSVVRGSGQDFADFLLGLPQQASRQFSLSADNISSAVVIRGRQLSLYVQDDWRWKARWTINYGLQYELQPPFTEASGRMVNLDAAADFSAVAPVQSGEAGPFSGAFPAGLVRIDGNNLAPRVGVAWRATNRSVLRFGYGLSYNSGSYVSIARQLYQQPPFFLTGTTLGSLDAPLTLTDAFNGISPSTVTNNYGIDRNYRLGEIHQWNVDYSRDLIRNWSAGVTYVGTGGTHLDMLRAPNRGPDGLRLEDVQPFRWQSSEGRSQMNGLSVRVQKRQSRGVSGSVSYTLSRSRDNTTATGGGATVAQDDRDLAAEWALSSFDRRHQWSGSLSAELPWGRNRLWLANGGWVAAVVGDWSMSGNLTWQSGTPLTVRCSTCATDVARGTGGTLRADYNGQPVAVADPSIDAFFNTAAFDLPEAGAFGTSRRNMVTGPGSHQLNASFTRDVSLGGNRNVSVNVNASNLLNTVNFGSVDTNINSPTFGQVLSVRGMRTVRLNLRFRF